jgi:ferrous iron transport protein A
MHAGQSGTVVDIAGGYGLVRRLQALGLRSGKRVTKVSSMFGRGPVTVKVGTTQIALGFGMARKILVQLDAK